MGEPTGVESECVVPSSRPRVIERFVSRVDGILIGMSFTAYVSPLLM
jgi:hypothetical protein